MDFHRPPGYEPSVPDTRRYRTRRALLTALPRYGPTTPRQVYKAFYTRKILFIDNV